MRRTVYLARHAETEWNRAGRWQGHTDIALNVEGRAQARALAESLRGHGIARVGSSDLARARETAEIVAAILSLPPVIVDPGLRERGFGCFEGLTREECMFRYPDAWTRYRADPREGPPGGEPSDAVIQRMTDAVRRVLTFEEAGEGRGPVLLVSHGGSIRSFVSAVTGVMPPPLQNGALYRVVVAIDGIAEVEPLADALAS